MISGVTAVMLAIAAGAPAPPPLNVVGALASGAPPMSSLARTTWLNVRHSQKAFTAWPSGRLSSAEAIFHPSRPEAP
jgi:hypothetical protein